MKTFFDQPFFDDAGERAATPPKPGRAVMMESSDRSVYDVSRGLTPERVDEIMIAANSGDTRDLCRISYEIAEKNWHVADSLSVRIAAVMKMPWTVEPAEDGADSKIADAFAAELKSCGGRGLDTFANLVNDMAYAVLPGLSCSEIIWVPGGKLDGFVSVPARSVIYNSNEFNKPQLDTTNGYVDMPPDKFILHRRRSPSGIPCRGGLIRTLAWLHCFMNINFKDLLRFVERYGMPFLTAKVSQDTWDKERNVLKSVIRNFGPDGGGLFTQGTELQLLQAANSDGTVYFKLLEYAERAITKVLLGQLASSSEGGQLGNNSAQSEVRSDLRDSDCGAIADCINDQLARPWTLFNFGSGATAPVFKFKTDPEEDIDKLATRVKTFYEAGLEADPKEMSDRAGITFTRRANAPASGFQPASVALSAERGSVAIRTAQEANAALAQDAAKSFISASGARWAGDLMSQIRAAIADESGAKLKALGQTSDLKKFKTEELANAIEGASIAAAANGVAAKAEHLKAGGSHA